MPYRGGRSAFEVKIGVICFVIALCLIPRPSFAASQLAYIGEVTGVYRRGTSLIVTLETSLKLPTGLVVYIDENRKIPAILKDHYKSTETTLIYEATVAKQVNISEGEKVFVEGEIHGKGADVYIKLDRRAVFLPKSEGQVLASHGPQVHIDRGSLHEVRERDIYAIYDSSGKYKGKAELAGIGDHQSIGRLYAGTKKEVGPGDTVKFLGQRKFFGLGVHYVEELSNSVAMGTVAEDIVEFRPLFGSGLVWWWTFPNGWGFKWIWGWYESWWDWVSDRWIEEWGGGEIERRSIKRFYVNYALPLTLRKNFFYPGVFSPYIGLACGGYETGIEMVAGESNRMKGLVVSPVIGFELFTTNLIHIYADGQYLYLPEVTLQDSRRQYKNWIVSFGVTTNW